MNPLKITTRLGATVAGGLLAAPILGAVAPFAQAVAFADEPLASADASVDVGASAAKVPFDEGHQIALHSNTHADMNAKTPKVIADEYVVNLKAVQDTIGKAPALARPPFGNCDAACAKVVGEDLTIIQDSPER